MNSPRNSWQEPTPPVLKYTPQGASVGEGGSNLIGQAASGRKAEVRWLLAREFAGQVSIRAIRPE